MPKSYEKQERTQAAARMSSDPNSVVRGSRGRRDQAIPWQTTKRRLARALIADTDVAFFFLYLASNRARKDTIALATNINQVIQALEGILYPQPLVSDTDSKYLVDTLDTIWEQVSNGGVPYEAMMTRMEEEAGEFVQSSILPTVRTGRRLQTKGAEAAKSFSESRENVVSGWPSLMVLVSRLAKSILFTVDTVRPLALETPVSSLKKTAEMTFPPEQARQYTLQLLAGQSAVSAMNRDLDLFYRYRDLEDDVFPTGISVEELEEVDGFITRLQLKNMSDAVVDPRLLGIRAKDLVTAYPYEDTVKYVGSDFILLNGTIPTGTSMEGVAIESSAGRAKTSLRESMFNHMSTLPGVQAIDDLMRSLEGRSIPEVKKSLLELSEISAQLHPIDSDTEQVLERFGLDPATPTTTLSDSLLEYSPSFLLKTKAAGLNALDLLRDDGFDRAEEYLIRGEIDEVIGMTYQDASYTGKFSESASDLAKGLSILQRSLGVRGRNG